MIRSGYAICCLHIFFSNSLILNKECVEIFPCKWSTVAGVSVLGFGGCGSLPSVPRALECGGIAILGPWGSGSTRSVLFGDIGPAGSGIWSRAASVFQFGSHSLFSFSL